MTSRDDLVRVARIGKPHGIRGEVTVEIFTDTPESRFSVGNKVDVRKVEQRQPPFGMLTVENARWNKKILLLKFQEVSDRNTAETLRNAELYAPAENMLSDADGWYAEELIGLTVHEGNFESEKIGEVLNLVPGEAQDLLEVSLLSGHEVLIPFVEDIVPEIDEKRGAIVITPPPGLLELNQD